MPRGLALVAVLMTASSTAAGPATASPARDLAATRSLIGVMTRYYTTGSSLMPQAGRAGTAFIDQVTKDCPGALDPSRLSTSQLPVANALNLEAGFDEYIEEFDVPFRAADLAASSALQRLRWSNALITRMIGKVQANMAYAASEKPTDACADINAAKAGGFTLLPAGTKQLLALVSGIPKPPSWRVMLTQLRPFISGNELLAVRRFVGIYNRWWSAGAKISARNSVRLDQVLGAG
jgi:hypothetical protein